MRRLIYILAILALVLVPTVRNDGSRYDAEPSSDTDCAMIEASK